MPEIATVLRLDLDPAFVEPVRTAMAGVDGVLAEPEVVATPALATATLVAAFHLAGDGAEVARQVTATGGEGRPPRAVLVTGEVVVVDGRVQGAARDRAEALAAQISREAGVVMAASTAVMVTHTLPPGVELVDIGVVRLPDGRDERAYLLHTVGAGTDDAGASSLGWAHRAVAHVLVGRAGPRARLEGAWTGALGGDHRLVVLSGDPGIGKTTLAAELAVRVHATGGIVLYGRWDEDGHVSYQAVREALGAYAAACPRRLLRTDLADRADDLARLLPDIGARIGGVRPPIAHDPDAERLRLYEAVRGWLGAIASRRPVLVVLDDLQWADRSSLLLLRHLLDSPPEGRVLLVATLRDGEVEGLGPLHTLGSFEHNPSVDRIDVPGLTSDEVAELIERTIGRPLHDPEEHDVARWLTDETAGNPLFVHEILRGLGDGEPARALAEVRDRLPERVHDVVRWRLARLGPETTAVLTAASVIGEGFSLDVLAAALGARPLEIRERLDDAVRAGVVRDTGDGQRLAFAHTVVRRALLMEAHPERTRALHLAVADALSRDERSAPPLAVAHHYLAAADADPDRADDGLVDRAIRWGRAAADQARRETAFESAVAFLCRVVDLHDRHVAGADRPARACERACELRLELAEAHDRAGEFVARDRRHLEAADLARELGRTDLFVRAALGYGGRLPAAPPPNPTARRLLEEALTLLPEEDSRARALVLARLAHVMHAEAPHRERKRLADEAEAMARRLDAPVVLASVLSSRVLALDGPDDVDEHLDIGEEIIRIGRQTGDRDLVLQGARARIHPLFVVAAHDAARDLAATFTELAEEVRHPDHLRLVAMWRIMWAALEGRFAEAEAASERLRVQLDLSGHPQVGTIPFVQTFVTRWMRGTLADLRTTVEAGRSSADSFTWRMLQAWVELGAGDQEAARALLDDCPLDELAEADAGYLWMYGTVGAAVVSSTVGDRRWAEAARQALAPYSGRNCVLGYAAYLGAVDHHLGCVEVTLGRLDDAVAHLEAALERHRTIGARPWAAVSAAWLANALVARGGPDDAERADRLWADAAEEAADLGLAILPAPHPQLAR
ncbi:MAG TPA: AAA family ATPase [Acidimicrobiales bacterium]|nr:AAA family ATPase [Acidimicrobiales bacterium]